MPLLPALDERQLPRLFRQTDAQTLDDVFFEKKRARWWRLRGCLSLSLPENMLVEKIEASQRKTFFLLFHGWDLQNLTFSKFLLFSSRCFLWPLPLSGRMGHLRRDTPFWGSGPSDVLVSTCPMSRGLGLDGEFEISLLFSATYFITLYSSWPEVFLFTFFIL